MARLILDTSLLVGIERVGLDSLDAVIADEDDVAIAAVTAAELMVGIELADASRRAGREEFLGGVLGAVSIEGYDLTVARSHASLLAHTRRTGRPRGAHDLIIAATGCATERIVLTADLDGFTDLPGVEIRPASEGSRASDTDSAA